jgi:carboxylate-amine ligase
MGRNTGFKSYRSLVFSSFPRSGIPGHFNSAEDYQTYVDLLIKTGCIDNGRKIWWDVRPHPVYGTIEVRVFDIATKAEEAVALAALVQALFVKLYKLQEQNLGFRDYHQRLLNENKWRAVRYGLDGHLIDFGRQKSMPARELLYELLEFVDDVVDGLGSRAEMAIVKKIIAEGTSADRQLQVFKETGDYKAVVDHLVKETQEGVPIPPPAKV